jgi:hypothetical protein
MTSFHHIILTNPHEIGHIFGENDQVYNVRGIPYIDHVMSPWLGQPPQLISHPVVDLRFMGVIALFPTLQWTGFSEKEKFGYEVGSPGGADSLTDTSGIKYMFHIFCPPKVES